MRWGSLYFPREKDLVEFGKPERNDLQDAIKLLAEANLPHRFFFHVDSVRLFTDTTIGQSSILGHTTFLKPNRVILSPLISNALTWKSQLGVPNNEVAMSTIIHELTHLQQFRDWKWYGWPIIHLPFLAKYTVEKWACENGNAAKKYLERQYRSKTKKYVFKRQLNGENNVSN